MIQDINTSIGTFDVSEEDFLFMKILWRTQSMTTMTSWFSYVILWPCLQASAFWKTVCGCNNPVWGASVYSGPVEKILQIKAFFEEKAGCSIYDLLPGVVENSLRQEGAYA